MQGFVPKDVHITTPEEVAHSLQGVVDVKRQEGWQNITCLPPSERPKGSKLVHLVRHGEGVHNEAARLHGRESYADPANMDARLTKLGESQAIEMQGYTAGLKPELVLVSPLSRALGTAAFGFDATGSGKDLKYLAHEGLRERWGINPCDKRRSKAELEVDYPYVDFSLLEEGEDKLYTPDEREPFESVAARLDGFLAWLKERPEEEVAIVFHSCSVSTMMNVNVKVSEEKLKAWFENSEARTVTFAWDLEES